MLLCIYFLPKYIGVNALIVGMAVSYVVSCGLNLILLRRVSPVKPRILSYIATSVIFIAPSSALGLFLKNLLFNRLPFAVALIFCIAVVGVFQFALFAVFGMTDFSEKLRQNVVRRNNDKRVSGRA